MANEWLVQRCDTAMLLRCRIRTRLKLILIVFKLKIKSIETRSRGKNASFAFTQYEMRIVHDQRFVQTTQHMLRQNKLFCLKIIMYSTAVLNHQHSEFDTIIRNKHFTCLNLDFYFICRLFDYINQRSDVILLIF